MEASFCQLHVCANTALYIKNLTQFQFLSLKYLFLTKKISLFTYSFAALIKLGDFHGKKGLKGD